MRNPTVLLASIILLIPFTGRSVSDNRGGKKEQGIVPAYVIKGATTDKSLKKNEALFVFTFFETGNRRVTGEITFSCDGESRKAKPDANGVYKLKVKPGKHIFQFFYTNRFEEIYMDSIKIPAAKRMAVDINFQAASMEVIADKPVIYLYPEKTKEVSVKLKPKDDFTFTYPAYKDGWNCVASPDGTLSFGEKKYGYLFWEAGIQISKDAFGLNEGYVVGKDKLVVFLEDKLYAMGLNAKEVQDFITYWYPRMSVNQNNYIHFMFNETWNEYAAMDVNPKPDNMFRVFMIWSKAADGDHSMLQPQKIPTLNRSGFTLVEWGGTEFSNDQLK
ncbi:MAG: hypothetical protein K0S33_1309 [Bacteroidetes bacterium]|jgi:hypothetical protein|nr:hypothetical protein [Bacteroidota bacterium]